LRRILSAFVNRHDGSYRTDEAGNARADVAHGETVHPPGLFHAGDRDQLDRLTASGCLDAKDVSHGRDAAHPSALPPGKPATVAAPLQIDRAAFLRDEAGSPFDEAGSPFVAEEAAEDTGSSQQGGDGGTGASAEPRPIEPGASPAVVSDGIKGVRPGVGSKPKPAGRGKTTARPRK
jgi:hypothetical protein